LKRNETTGGRLRFAEAVCSGHPDRLADTIADRIVALACERDPHSLVGVEIAIDRNSVFITGRVASGTGGRCAVSQDDLAGICRDVYRDAGYGDTPSGRFEPSPEALQIHPSLLLEPLDSEERAIRDYSDDQVIAVGHACQGKRADYRPLEQALATDFAIALESLRVSRPDLGLGPDGKTLVALKGRQLVAVSLSVHHRPDADWTHLTHAARAACLSVAIEYVEAGELDPPDEDVSWLVNGAGAFSCGGPNGDNGLSGKKLVAEAYGTGIPIGGGTIHGKDPRKPDVRGQQVARERALALVANGAVEATVWVVYRPGDREPAFIEEDCKFDISVEERNAA
jgi:S-adenosylmethionine synthetase